MVLVQGGTLARGYAGYIHVTEESGVSDRDPEHFVSKIGRVQLYSLAQKSGKIDQKVSKLSKERSNSNSNICQCAITQKPYTDNTFSCYHHAVG